METFLGLLTTLIFSFTSAELPVFDFNCVAQLLSDIDVLPEDLIIESYSVESKLVIISVIKSPGPDQTRICAAEMAVRYAALSACRKVHP